MNEQTQPALNRHSVTLVVPACNAAQLLAWVMAALRIRRVTLPLGLV